MCSYGIKGGDYDLAGSAASGLKEQLKRIGADPAAIRRAIIAAYEAEMNVVIHADKGTMRATLDAEQVDVEVADEGPGIPDIEQAMVEGFSTAPAAARELGFGAGMGLPNIKKNSDCFNIDSTAGKGTRVAFTIYLKPGGPSAASRNSLRVAEELCRECRRCLFACPTEALRVRDNAPKILRHLCVDCAKCIEVCATGALTTNDTGEVPKPAVDTVLVLPAAFFSQFGAGIAARHVAAALEEMGFDKVITTDAWEHALGKAVAQYAREEANTRPVISPACPAVVNLIEMRFPALIEHLAPFLSPMEAIRHELNGWAVFVAACPCQQTALFSSPPSGETEVVGPSGLRQALARLLGRHVRASDLPATPRRSKEETRGGLAVSGMEHVAAVLETAENGLLTDVGVLEPFACDHGCFGSPLWPENAFIARRRWDAWQGTVEMFPKAVRREAPFVRRAGARLDADMKEAISKLARIDEIAKRLPGKDCGICGAPTCRAFAEDVILGRASRESCIYLVDSGKEESE